MLISVCMIAYNHEPYILEAMNGVLMQKSNFDIEFIISNDHSTDNTHQEIENCIKKYEGHIKIKYFNHEQNLGMMANFIFALNQCKGDFTSLCEGDDYWTDPLKLQKQINYISLHDDCVLVFTDAKVLNENTNQFLPNWANIKREKYEFKDLVERNIITTCTSLFRNPQRNTELSNYLLNFKIGDYPLYLFLLQTGYAYFIQDETAVYRQHGGGVFSLKDSNHMIETNIDLLNTLKNTKKTGVHLFYIKRNLIKWYYAKVIRMSNDLNPTNIRSYIIEKLKISDFFFNPYYFIRIVILFFFPKLKSNVFHFDPKT